MATPTFYVFDGDPDNNISPRRPGIDDVGGAEKENDSDSGFVPDPRTMPTAEDENQAERLLVGLAAVADMVRGVVHFASGTPSIFGIRAPGQQLVSGDFTVTDLGIGLTKIACPATKIVPPLYAKAFVQATGNNTAVAYVSGSGNEITVETRTAGALADLNFAFEWY